MTNASLWTRLGEASARVRAAAALGEDDVLAALADAGRTVAGTTGAWAAAFDESAVRSPHSAVAGDAAPPFGELLGAESVVRSSAFVAVSLAGPGSAPAGIVVVPLTVADDLDEALVQLAVVGSLALECTRLRRSTESMTKSREVLMGSVSHDLRNPLNTFAMSAGLLRDDLERNDVDATRGIALVSRMDRASSRMQSMIEDLVEASRVDAKKIDYVLRVERAAQIVRDAVAAATKAAASDRSAAVTLDEVDDDASVSVDRARTLQMLSKTVAFAAKATGDGGSIRLGVRREAGSVVFTARAFGPGGTAVAPPDEGRAGLVLLLARGLAEAQGGSFRIGGQDGLTVRITLPAAQA